MEVAWAVWAWADSTVSGPPAFHVSFSICLLGCSRTTRVSSVWLSLYFCWACPTQLTSVLIVRLYLIFLPPITTLGPDLEETLGVCTHGGHPLESSSCRSLPSPDSHLSLFPPIPDQYITCFSVYKSQPPAREIQNCHGRGLWRSLE